MKKKKIIEFLNRMLSNQNIDNISKRKLFKYQEIIKY